jgi:DNA-binding beta-propeller fold protein YncE
LHPSIRKCTAKGYESLRDHRRGLLAGVVAVVAVLSTAPLQAQELCGSVDYPFPYTDVASVGAAFCPGIMEAYVTGVSKGTTPTTFSPNETVTRVQMTTFLQRSLDQGLTRASRRAALNQWAIPQNVNAMQTIGGGNQYCATDGQFVWAENAVFGEVEQVEASSGTVLGTWTNATIASGVVVAGGKVFVAGNTSPGKVYLIDPTQAPGNVTVAATGLGNKPLSIAFDGTNLWTANFGGSVSIIPVLSSTPYTVTNVSAGFSTPWGIVFDGAHIWVVDAGSRTLLKLSAAGAVLQSVPIGHNPQFPGFDGANIWVPNYDDNSITVVQASSGTVVATIVADSNNHLNGPEAVAFDGERVLVTNNNGGSVTLFKAADLSFIANVPLGSPYGVCSDGINFWVTATTGNVFRF